MKATGVWSNTSWNELEIDAREGAKKLVTVTMTTSYEGTLQGRSTVNYLMVYGDDGNGVAVGLERFEGSVDGKHGTFVLKHDGTFSAKDVTMSAEIVPGSATGELIGIRGARREVLSGHGPYPYEFEISFT